MNNTIKNFEIVDFPEVNKNFGNYKANTPKKAASLAFDFLSNIIEQDIIDDDTFMVFIIRNKVTKKEYKYIGTRIKLENPVKKNINGEEIIFNYKNVIGKYNKALDDIY